MRKLSVLFLAIALLFPSIVYAQFGANNVRYNSLDQLYKSHRFDVMHNLDPNDPVQMEYLRQVIDNLESARDWMGGSKIFNHNIEKRIPIFFYKTHTDMESSNLVGGFLPEGVGAFVESQRKRMVLKADFSRPLGRAIGVHELVHEFQFDIYNPSLIQRAVGSDKPNGWYEGCAEFLAGLYDPHTRDDIRRREQRSFASNPKSLPTWETLNSNTINPYTMWSMIPEFLEDKFSVGLTFCTQPLKNNLGLGEFVYDTMKGELGNPDVNSERFDQQNRHYWGTEKGFEVGRINRPKPYEENDNFRGWTITPHGHPYKMFSPILSPNGLEIAAFTYQKNGVALVKYTIPKEGVYLSKKEREKAKSGSILKRLGSEPDLVKNLTPQLPPVPWEYLVVQGLETWSIFNGSDAAWSRDGKQIAFFARINRDHALVIVDADTGKVLKKIEFESPGWKLDQAFSPSFSQDGKYIYFSAVKNITRDIYIVSLESGEVLYNLTQDDGFDTAPALSPGGNKIVYVSSDGDFQHLFLLDTGTGKKEQLTFGDFNDSSPSWSDDGSALVYTSDETDRIWNLYTFDLATRTVSQWTEFIGEVKTPTFAKGSLNTVYYSVFHDDDQYRDFIYPNYEVFAAELKKAIRQYVAVDTGASSSFAFNPNRDLFKLQLDSNQLLNPTKPSERWGCEGGDISIGVNTYYGMFGQSYFGCSNLLETKRHLGQFALYGSVRLLNYSYVNQEKRTTWLWGVSYNQLPLVYQHYDIVKGRPAQPVINQTWVKESSFNLATLYPLNKFNRFELYSRLRHRSFTTGISRGDVDKFPESFNQNDAQLVRFFDNSTGSNFVFGTAYVRDTVLNSGNTWGPFHGNALRAQVEVAPPLGQEFQGYLSANISARTYRHLGSSSLLAGRVDLMANTRANGDFMLLGGPEYGRGEKYGSTVGNQVGYASAELRFPIPATYVLGTPIRGFIFSDVAYARFSDERFPAQRIGTYGFGAHYLIPFIGLPAQTVWRRNNGKWNSTFYITMNW